MTPSRPICLIGYRGTGKSTVGKLLADRLGFSFCDADVLLERRAGCTIREMFAAQGETAFRDLESVIVAELTELPNSVLALGGGVVLRAENRAALKRGQVIWLRAPAATIHERLASDATTSDRRPNLTSQGGMDEITTLLAAREAYYRECADYSVDAASKSPAQLVDDIVVLLHR